MTRGVIVGIGYIWGSFIRGESHAPTGLPVETAIYPEAGFGHIVLLSITARSDVDISTYLATMISRLNNLY